VQAPALLIDFFKRPLVALSKKNADIISEKPVNHRANTPEGRGLAKLFFEALHTQKDHRSIFAVKTGIKRIVIYFIVQRCVIKIHKNGAVL
jgi:hypothetical protein